MVRDEGEGVAVRLRLVQDHAETVEKEVPVIIITEDHPPLDACNDVMQAPAASMGFAWHVGRPCRLLARPLLEEGSHR